MVGTPWIVLLAAVRNVALVVLLVGAVFRLVQLGRRAPEGATSTVEAEPSEPSEPPVPPVSQPDPGPVANA